MADGWFLVQFKPNSHNIAARNLKRQGFEIFLPLHETTRRLATRFLSELKPLFPGYMFIRVDTANTLLRKVNSTYGVAGIVGFGGTPAPVPSGLVEGLLGRCDEMGGVRTNEALEAGQRVLVVDGPFSEFVGTVEKIDAQQRVWLLLEFMGQDTRIHLAATQVARTQT